MKKLFITIALIALLLPVLAFGAPFLTSDPHPTCQQFRVYLNGVDMGIAEGKLDVESGKYVIWYDLIGIAEGDYIAEAKAVNIWEESGKSAPLNFTKVIPMAPLNLHVSGK